MQNTSPLPALCLPGGSSSGLRALLAAGMSISVVGYDMVKLANWAAAQAEKHLPDARAMQEYKRWLAKKILQLGECPMSDNVPDMTSVKWGGRGVAAGVMTQTVNDRDF